MNACLRFLRTTYLFTPPATVLTLTQQVNRLNTTTINPGVFSIVFKIPFTFLLVPVCRQ